MIVLDRAYGFDRFSSALERRDAMTALNLETDIAVIGGGLVGAATAYGLACEGRAVRVLDEGDVALCASRAISRSSGGVQRARHARRRGVDQGVGGRTAGACRRAARGYGVDVALSQRGFHARVVVRGDAGAHQYERDGYTTNRHGGNTSQNPRPSETRKRLPAIGRDAVVIYCPLDGHVHSLRLFRSLHQAMERHGVVYRPNRAVETITPMVQASAVKALGRAAAVSSRSRGP